MISIPIVLLRASSIPAAVTDIHSHVFLFFEYHFIAIAVDLSFSAIIDHYSQYFSCFEQYPCLRVSRSTDNFKLLLFFPHYIQGCSCCAGIELHECEFKLHQHFHFSVKVAILIWVPTSFKSTQWFVGTVRSIINHHF